MIQIWVLFLIALGCFGNISKIVTLSPNTVIATIPVGTNPNGLAITPDNRFVYVVNENSNSVSVISVATNTVVTTISGFDGPTWVAINPQGTLAYVTNGGSSTVSIIDIATNTIINSIPDFFVPDDMVINASGAVGYVANFGIFPADPSTNVSVVDLINNLNLSQIVVGSAVSEVALTPNGKFLYASSFNSDTAGSGTVSVINTANNTVIDTIPGFFGPFDTAITPDGKFAYVTNFGSIDFSPYGSTVSVIDLTSNTIVDTIQVGIQPTGVAITPDGSLVYVTNYNAPSNVPGIGTVNIIDAATNTVLPQAILVGNGPQAIAITPNGAFAYVPNFISNSVSVIALQPFTIQATGCQTSDTFLMERDIINKLTWSVTGSIVPVSYTIYRDATLTNIAGIVPATEPLQFLDHNRVPGAPATYYLVGTTATGLVSNPVVISVTQACN